VYLKQIELIGFKSFAEKTRLQFEPGMIAIVGPNGCGKSNISDAIRWVLGEQRPTALRCAKMADVVFNGTDSRKPLGMAEVSITFADCEGFLETEFNEVTVTRRVFRSGEGQYFINKTPCRLKDVQRLFMGTGIGTTSYSVMAQGQIDIILSSRPEDRRIVFEEAAGITKFKADRKEAMRKIDQTDANLLRLADVIREVKRQIGTLQRQAGKAQKYKELRDELRGLDIFLTRRRLAALDIRIRELDTTIHALHEQWSSHQEFVAEAEAESSRIHGLIHETEERIANLTEQATQADNRYLRAQEVIKVNEQRIAEYRAWAERDNREISETRTQIEQLRLQQESLTQKRLLLQQNEEVEQKALKEAQTQFDAHRLQIEQTRAQLQQDRQKSVECERRTAQIQQELADMEARQRELLMKRDRLAAEHGQMQETLAATEQACAEVQARLDTLTAEVAATDERFEARNAEQAAVAEELNTLQAESARLQSEAAAKRAQIELLKDAGEARDDYAPGSQLLLDPANPLGLEPQTVLGPLAEMFNAPPDLRLALEAALRAWLDAVIVRDAESARQIFALLLARGTPAAARVIAASSQGLSGGVDPDAPLSPPSPGLTPLLDRVTVEEPFSEAARRLLGTVFLAESLDAVPAVLPAGCRVVTRDGVIAHADGCAELWMPDSPVSSPLARKLLAAEAADQLAVLETTFRTTRTRQEQLAARSAELSLNLTQMRKTLDENRRRAAQAEGEHQSVSRDAERARARLDHVSRELGALNEQTSGDEEIRAAHTNELDELTVMRASLLERIAENSTLLQEREGVFSELSHTLTECRIRVSSVSQQIEHAVGQREAIQTRMDELERTVQGRNRGVMSYDESIERLAQEIASLEANLDPMRITAETLHQKIEETRRERAARQSDLEKTDATLTERRRELETVREQRSRAEIDLAESRIRRQNHLDHVYNEYGLSPEELVAHADPAWKEGGPPPISEIEARTTSLNADIQALGPVNLVAIEEHKELEERYSFLKAQEEDLLKSKEQILELIAMINKKSSEMFQSTFDQANAHFSTMFTRLFNGGQAKLVLLENAEDPLECGIDIIARPPGKRPQSITLLSGGERTMTAVSLLFAIFMIKPAPFCMLDELDAALDDSNIGRFVQTLKDFLKHSQFLIITHNQHTIASSDIVYGVTQQEKGISKIVSMRLKEIGIKPLELGVSEDAANAVSAVEEPPPRSRRRGRKKKSGDDAAPDPEVSAPAE
jgi:chromosome segregation protein